MVSPRAYVNLPHAGGEGTVGVWIRKQDLKHLKGLKTLADGMHKVLDDDSDKSCVKMLYRAMLPYAEDTPKHVAYTVLDLCLFIQNSCFANEKICDWSDANEREDVRISTFIFDDKQIRKVLTGTDNKKWHNKAYTYAEMKPKFEFEVWPSKASKLDFHYDVLNASVRIYNIDHTATYADFNCADNTPGGIQWITQDEWIGEAEFATLTCVVTGCRLWGNLKHVSAQLHALQCTESPLVYMVTEAFLMTLSNGDTAQWFKKGGVDEEDCDTAARWMRSAITYYQDSYRDMCWGSHVAGADDGDTSDEYNKDNASMNWNDKYAGGYKGALPDSLPATMLASLPLGVFSIIRGLTTKKDNYTNSLLALKATLSLAYTTQKVIEWAAPYANTHLGSAGWGWAACILPVGAILDCSDIAKEVVKAKTCNKVIDVVKAIEPQALKIYNEAVGEKKISASYLIYGLDQIRRHCDADMYLAAARSMYLGSYTLASTTLCILSYIAASIALVIPNLILMAVKILEGLYYMIVAIGKYIVRYSRKQVYRQALTGNGKIAYKCERVGNATMVFDVRRIRPFCYTAGDYLRYVAADQWRMAMLNVGYADIKKLWRSLSSLAFGLGDNATEQSYARCYAMYDECTLQGFLHGVVADVCQIKSSSVSTNKYDAIHWEAYM